MVAGQGGSEQGDQPLGPVIRSSIEQLVGQPHHGTGHAGSTRLLTIQACLPTCRSRLNP